MLKLSCNVTDNLHNFFYDSRPLIPVHKRTITISSSQLRRDLLRTAISTNQGSHMADRLRPGRRLMENGYLYKEIFVVRSYEVGINKTATIQTIAKLLQEVQCNDLGFSTDGFGQTLTMRKLHLIWVMLRMHIEMYKYPAWSDVIEIETCFQGEGRNAARSDWILSDCTTGEVIGRATSKWVLMNQDTRQLQRIPDEVRDECFAFFPPETPRLTVPKENNSIFKIIPKLEDPAQYSMLGIKPKRADLDINQHVNHVTYIGWVLESIPQEIIDTHDLKVITLDYKRECRQNDIVESLTSSDIPNEAKDVSTTSGKERHDEITFLHLLRLSKNGQEINRGRTQWRKKSSSDGVEETRWSRGGKTKKDQ